MNEVEIRKVKEEDIEAIIGIKIDGWQTAYRGIIDDKYLEALNKEEKLAKMKEDYSQDGFIVAVMEGKIVGFCRYIGSNEFSSEYEEIDCELCALYVKSDLKRNGIGRKLFLYVVNQFVKEQKSKMILWCLKENSAGRAFYEKMGGQVYTEKKEKIGEKEYEEVAFLYDLVSMKI